MSDPYVNTYSIVAFDPQDSSMGIAVASKFLAVGAIVPYAKADAGAIATQSLANQAYGEAALKMMAEGLHAQEVLDKLLYDDKDREERQLGIVDKHGNAVTFTGTQCMNWAGGKAGKGYAIQGNILVSEETIHAMAETFENTEGELADRLYAALSAGDKAGGDSRGRQSASLLIVKPHGGYGGYNDRYLDLRVDNHLQPLEELGKLLKLHHIFMGSTKTKDKIKIEKDLVLELQQLLVELGFYSGKIDGEWSSATQAAFSQFMDRENLENRVNIVEGLIDPPALDYIRHTFLS